MQKSIDIDSDTYRFFWNFEGIFGVTYVSEILLTDRPQVDDIWASRYFILFAFFANSKWHIFHTWMNGRTMQITFVCMCERKNTKKENKRNFANQNSCRRHGGKCQDPLCELFSNATNFIAKVCIFNASGTGAFDKNQELPRIFNNNKYTMDHTLGFPLFRVIRTWFVWRELSVFDGGVVCDAKSAALMSNLYAISIVSREKCRFLPSSFTFSIFWYYAFVIRTFAIWEPFNLCAF